MSRASPGCDRPEPTLLCDIGGTSSRTALLVDGRPGPIDIVENDRFTSFEHLIADRLGAMTGPRPRRAVIAWAGPVTDGELCLTNRGWRFTRADLRERFGFSSVDVLNDFEAVAWALPALGAGDLESIAEGVERPARTKLVLGPGTGLGVGALVPTAAGWQAVATECGYVTFGPIHDGEAKLFAAVAGPLGRHPCPEDFLSGRGLRAIHAAQHGETLDAAEIGRRALAGEGRALATVATFSRLLGRFAGDLALVFRAEGGVYLTGGVLRRLAPVMDWNGFLAAFCHHPPYEHLLWAITIRRILVEEPGILGCAAYASHVREPLDRAGAV